MQEQHPFFHFGMESIAANDLLNELIRSAHAKGSDFESFVKEFELFRESYPEANTDEVEHKVLQFMKENNLSLP